jgi:UPF0271 protein
LDAIAAAEGTSVSYLKPHGALYNAVVHHQAQAAAVIAAAVAFRPGLAIYGLPGSVLLHRAADAGLRPVGECFADRAYTAEATLVPRRLPHAVLHDATAIAARVVQMATEATVLAEDGSTVSLAGHHRGDELQSVCLHGDTRGAVAIARAVRAALLSAGVQIAPVLR